MKATVENAKLLATLLAVIQKENSKSKDSLYEQLYTALQEDIDSQSGVKLLQVEGIEEPIPIQVFRGDKGDVGLEGKRGLLGEQGEQGVRGDQGARGEQGIQGEAGRVGPQGLQGDQGETGEQGEQGLAGVDGQDFDSRDLEKHFTELYNAFTRQISSQITRMAMARGGGSGGGGEVRLEFLDDVNRNSVKQDGYFLKYDANTKKWVGDAANNFTTTITTHSIIPETSNTYSLGTADKNWKELYLSGNTMFLGGVSISAQSSNTGTQTLKIGSNGTVQDLVSNNYLSTTYMSNTDTRAFVLGEVAKVVNAAPTALNTLVEISTALGGDANFANTITTTINNKASNTYVQSLLSNTNAYIASVEATLPSLATNAYAKSIGISSATFNSSNNTITFLRPDASDLKVTVNAGGGGGAGDVSNAYLTSTYVANTEFQRVLANTNAYIASVVLSGNTTSIGNADSSNGASLIATNINNNVTLKRIKAGRNIEIEQVDGDIVITAIPQKDYGFLSDDYGSIQNASEQSVDYGTL
jgi:hypothetical protein